MRAREKETEKDNYTNPLPANEQHSGRERDLEKKVRGRQRARGR